MTATLQTSAAAADRRYDTQIHRRPTRTVMVGDVAIGGDPGGRWSMIEDTLESRRRWRG